MNSKLTEKIHTIYRWFFCGTEKFQSVLLLIIRLYWGYQFFQAGKGKLMDLNKPAAYFVELGIPFPKFNALLAGSTECFGGLLLMLGLSSRIVSVPLAFTMVIAYVTADREALMGMFQDPEPFLTAAPFLFLLASLIVLAFGPGVISLDWLVARKFGKQLRN